jgi:Rrf2 family protein
VLTRKAKYALKALFDLAEMPPGQPMLIADIAARRGIPKKFLDTILLELRNRGLLQSRKGRGGGYQLALSPETINIGTIIRLIDGPLALVPCVAEGGVRCADCSGEEACQIRKLMAEVSHAMENILDHCSLADIVAAGDTDRFVLNFEI